MIRRISILALLFFLVLNLSAQELSTRSKKAIRYYDEARSYMQYRQYPEALDALQLAIDKDNEFVEAYYLSGVILKEVNQYEIALEYLEKARDIGPRRGVVLGGLDFHLGEVYFRTGDYSAAAEHLERYLATNPDNNRRRMLADSWYEDVVFALDNMNSDIQIEPRPLDPVVNAFELQYFPVLTLDQQTLIYTRRLGYMPTDDEDIVISKMMEGKWTKPESISDKINTEYNEGTTAISGDGRTLIFTACQNRERYGSCDLFVAEKVGDEWQEPVNMGKAINSPSWESQPSLSADGRTLFFVSDRRGVGRRDIWISQKNEQDQWLPAYNPGPSINTAGDEISPFIHANGNILYFSSDGRRGFGGMDIYYTRREGSEWTEPVNYGYPVNTTDDQVSLFVTRDGEQAYYSHEVRDRGRRRSFLFTFEVPEELRQATPSNYVFGRISDADSDQSLRARVSLFDLSGEQELVARVYSDSVTGEYLFPLTEGFDYALHVDRKGYLFNSRNFTKEENLLKDPIRVDIQLQPITTGATTTLNNIFFDFDSYALKESSHAELRNIITFLNENPGVSVVIEGHTDDVGEAEYNLDLSRRRARAVYAYLVEAGVSGDRLEFVGFGMQKPRVPNDSEENRAQNRRIEFRIKKINLKQG